MDEQELAELEAEYKGGTSDEAKHIQNLCAEIRSLRAESWNAQRIIEWMDDPTRKPAIHAFTAGNERQIAYRFERVVVNAASTRVDVQT